MNEWIFDSQVTCGVCLCFTDDLSLTVAVHCLFTPCELMPVNSVQTLRLFL